MIFPSTALLIFRKFYEAGFHRALLTSSISQHQKLKIGCVLYKVFTVEILTLKMRSAWVGPKKSNKNDQWLKGEGVFSFRREGWEETNKSLHVFKKLWPSNRFQYEVNAMTVSVMALSSNKNESGWN